MDRRKVYSARIPRNKPEQWEQKAFIRWFDLAYPSFALLLWHTPNGGSRHPMEALNLRLMGVKSGVPDLFLAVPRGAFHGLFIEMKAGKGRATANQLKYIQLLREYGYRAEIANLDEAMDIIKGYLDGYQSGIISAAG